MNVPGEKIEVTGEPAINQDFILMNTKSFVAKDVKDFYHVLQVVTMKPLAGAGIIKNSIYF